MFLNWAYTNNGGKPIQYRIDSSRYILKLLALVSGAQRGLFQMVHDAHYADAGPLCPNDVHYAHYADAGGKLRTGNMPLNQNNTAYKSEKLLKF